MLTRAAPVARAAAQRRVVADAAGEFDLDVEPADHLGQQRRVRAPTEGGVEVDQVHPLGAAVLPGQGGLERVAVRRSPSRPRPGPGGPPGRRPRRPRAAASASQLSFPSGRTTPRRTRAAPATMSSQNAIRTGQRVDQVPDHPEPARARAAPAIAARWAGLRRPSSQAAGARASAAATLDGSARRRDRRRSTGAAASPARRGRAASRSARRRARSLLTGPRRRAGPGRSQRPSQLRSSAAPASPDFSGWNWVAASGPVSTAATNGPPWTVVVTQPPVASSSVARVGGVGVDEVEPGRPPAARRTAPTRPARSTVFQPMCGTRCAASRVTPPGSRPRPLVTTPCSSP